MNISIDRWEALRRFTDARIALGRAGNSVPTAPLLAFNLAHAQARDAVHQPLDVVALAQSLDAAGFDSLHVRSAAPTRDVYLRRPDLGRVLDDESAAHLARFASGDHARPDVVFVIADGLSSNASAHALPLMRETISRLEGWRVGPVVVATQARVALGDRVGSLLRARIVVVLIGERPGLSSPASLGAYITYDPFPGCNDSHRNCVSNIRPEGLTYEAAGFRLAWLLDNAMKRQITGVGLKDDSGLALTAIRSNADSCRSRI